MKKKVRSHRAFLMVANSTPNAGNCVVSTRRLRMHMKTMQTPDTLRYSRKSRPAFCHRSKSASLCKGSEKSRLWI